VEIPPSLGLLLILGLVLLNGFFVATEFAIVAVRRSRLEELTEAGSRRAATALEVVRHLDAYIAACQLGITMASLALGWIGEPALARLLEAPLARLLGSVAPAAAHGVAITITFAFITGLHIVLGELAPKGLALQHPDGTTLWVARPMQVFYALFRWPITALNAIGNGTLRLFGLRPAAGHELVHSVEELRLLVTGSQQAGVVEASEARIAKRAFVFADLTAGAVMTPRTLIEAVPATITLEALVARVAASTHSRLPVYEGSLDQILGVLHVRDLFPVLAHPAGGFELRGLLRPVLTVPESKPADDLLEDMRTSRRHLAVVVDEYGGTSGIVVLEDLMESLVGRIEDEPVGGSPGAPRPPAPAEPDGSRLLDGLTRIHELEEILGTRIDEADEAGVETLSGLVMATLGRLPAVGDAINVAGRTLRVERLQGRRVAAARLLAPPPAASAAPTDPPE
jgi:CBS domain containing-hemolysin-like protein